MQLLTDVVFTEPDMVPARFKQSHAGRESHAWAHSLEWLSHCRQLPDVPESADDGVRIANRHIVVLQALESQQVVEQRAERYERLREAAALKKGDAASRMALRIEEIRGEEVATNLTARGDDNTSQERRIAGNETALRDAISAFDATLRHTTRLGQNCRFLLSIRFRDSEGYVFAASSIRAPDGRLYYFFFDPARGERALSVGAGESAARLIQDYLGESLASLDRSESDVLRLTWLRCRRR